MKKHEITRRSFLRGTAAGAAGLACAGLVSAPVLAAEEAKKEEETTDWLGSAPKIDEKDVINTFDTEVLVVGSGTAGVFAACSAVDEGAQVILIEKFNEDFGGSGIRDTLGAIGSKQQLANNDNPDMFDVITEMYRQSNGYGDQKLYKLWAENSGETVDWYTDRLAEENIPFLHEVDTHDTEVRYPIFDIGHSIQWEDREYDPTFSSKLLKAQYVEKGMTVHYDTSMIELIMEDGKVIGCYAETEDGIVRYNASKGVIVCTGGYSLNYDMLNALQPETVKMINNNSSFPGSRGDGIKACLWAGGQFDTVHGGVIFDRGAVKPDAVGTTGNDYLFWMGSQPFLKVDLNGNRFTNESGCYDHILHTALNLPGNTYCMVWDANYVSDIERFDTHGCSRMYPHANGTEAVWPIDYNEYVIMPAAREDGYVVTADTLEELAEKLNIPAETFLATAERYNELYDQGKDEDFGKEAFRLSELRTPPFEGVRLSGGYFIATFDGIKINEDINVVDENGEAIEGLYCAGDCSGGYFATSYPNLLAGAAAGRSATFGRLAGRNAAHREV